MSTYADLDSVRGRVPLRTINATSRPDQDQVQTWLDEAEAKLNGTLQRAKLPAPYDPVTQAQAALILGMIVADYAEGRVRMAYAASADGGAIDPDDGKDLVQKFEDTITSIRRDPDGWGAELGGGTAPAASVTPRSFWTDRATDDDDVGPAFTRTTEL